MIFREIVATVDVTFTCFVLPIFDVIDHRSCYVYTWPTRFGSLDLLLESRSPAIFYRTTCCIWYFFFFQTTSDSKLKSANL